MIIFLNREFKRISKEELHSLSPGILEGQGAFETMHVVEGNILDQENHLNRLHRGLSRFGIARKITSSFLQETTKKLLKRNKLKNARLRLSVTKYRGKINVILVAQRIGTLKKSYSLCVSPTRRPLNSLTHLKSIRYEIFREGLMDAQSKGYDEALFLNRHHHIVEASTANIFWLKGKTLYTPSQSCGCLNGITKRKILDRARQLGLKIRKGTFTLKHLKSAEAVYLTNSLIGIKPVSRLEGQRFKIFKLLMV